jgi:phosphate/sulfate permease
MYRMLIGTGLLLAAVGLLLAGLGALLGVLGPRGGRLPGDVVIQRPGLTVYLPVMTSVILSLLLTLIVWVVGAWWRR